MKPLGLLSKSVLRRCPLHDRSSTESGSPSAGAGHGRAISRAHIGASASGVISMGRLRMGSLQTIDHIVVLMLENRSFDSLLGSLYPKSDSFEGLNGTEQNPDANGSPVGAWNSPGTDETTMRIPNPDPGELWTDINMQLFGDSAPAPGQRPTMVGFVQNYLAQRQLNRQQTYDPTSVMHYFAPAQLPVLSQLAQKFAVCDHWFASAPRSVMTEAADFMCPRCTSR